MVQVSAIGLFDVIEDILTGHNVGKVSSWYKAAYQIMFFLCRSAAVAVRAWANTC